VIGRVLGRVLGRVHFAEDHPAARREPVASSETAAGRRQNRRTEITLLVE